MMLKNVTKENAWDACEAVWAEILRMLKENPNVFDDDFWGTKAKAVAAAGYKPCKYCCPMCEAYCNSNDQCTGCPIAEYRGGKMACEHNTYYGEFSDSTCLHYAELFAAELKKIRALDEANREADAS